MSAKQSVVITGASTGIGWATVKVLLGKGFRVFGTVRKHADADRLSKDFGPDFIPLLADVTDEAAVQQAAERVGEMLGRGRLAGLVNNAGIVVGGPLLHLGPDEIRHQMEVNLIGPFMVTKAFAPSSAVTRPEPASPGASCRSAPSPARWAYPSSGHIALPSSLWRACPKVCAAN